MRNRISLVELQEQWKKEQKEKAHREAHRFDGLEECRRNVVKCNCFKKLKYCVSTKEM